MISTTLNTIFQDAIHFAKESHHEYITIEHVVYTILLSDDGATLLKNCGANVESMKKQLLDFLLTQLERLPSEVIPIESLTLSRVIESMIHHIQSAQKENATIGDLLIALYDEKQTYSYLLLKEYQIERLDILELISHPEEEKIEKVNRDSNSFLEKYTVNLIEKAKNNKIDPVIGREKEIERVIEILCRRKKNNPLLIGEAGVGKTAIAEGLALKIIHNDIPKILQKMQLYSLDMSALISGTKYRGEFEKRLKGIIDEMKLIKKPLLFIDEIHTLVGAGATSGSMDAANLLKPALANGDITSIGATTYTEYRNSFGKDKALSRRFSKVDIKEPSEKMSFKILQGLKKKYEEHHNIKYTNKALKSAVYLSKRYINDRCLPDKAIDIIDETAATFHLHKKRRKIVKESDIKKTISKIAAIPLQTMNIKENKILQNLKKNISNNVIGQEKAVEEVVNAIQLAKAGLTPSDKPIGSFLFMGQTGVGKTELAITLANQLGIHFERFDMSEYMEKHSLSRLVGAPPGYIGYDEGGLLTEAIKKHPHSVLLLDEIEKADKELINILLQIMDNATLTDSNGYKIDFQNVILIMTSNIGATSRSVMGFNHDDTLSSHEDLKDFFTPEFRNRLDAIVTFEVLEIITLVNIVKKFILMLNKTLKKKHITVTITQKTANGIAKEIKKLNMGARPIQKYIQNNITKKISKEILFGRLQHGGIVECNYIKKLTLKYKNDSST